MENKDITRHLVKESRDVVVLHEQGKVKEGDVVEFECGALELITFIYDGKIFHIGQGDFGEKAHIDSGFYNMASGGTHLSRHYPNHTEIGRQTEKDEGRKFREYKQQLQEAGIWKD